MAKFAIECPHCGTINQASTFIFSKKVIECGSCGQEINVKSSRLTSRKCPHCKSVFVYDQAKPKHTCPSCHKGITEGFGKVVSFPCPQCACIVQVDENTKDTTCPVCEHRIENVEKEIAKQKAVSDTGVNVIKYEGDNETFVWKHPLEDFNYGSQLIVHESQEAIFFMDGHALDTFGPGRYSLETENIPALKKLNPMPTGKQNPFHAEVYFVNKTVQMSIPWGTPDKIRFMEPTTGAPVEMGVHGHLNLTVSDARKLLIKLVGTTGGIAWENPQKTTASLNNAFRPLIQTCVRSNIAGVIKAQNIDILEIDERLEELSGFLKPKLCQGFEEYGLTIPEFYITGVMLDGNETIERLKHLRTQNLNIKEHEFEASMVAAKRKVVLEQKETELTEAQFAAEKARIEAQAQADAATIKGAAGIELKRQSGLADAEVMKAQGYSQKDVLQAEVQKAYAEGIGNMGGNGGGGGAISEMMGLGVGLAAMGTIGEKVGDAMKGFTNPSDAPSAAAANGWKCVCGQEGNTGKFCMECGKPKPEAWTCPACGATDNKGKFCMECGKPKPEAWTCPACGATGNKGKFCMECGKPREADSAPAGWDCSCGNKGITGKFCSECGAKKEDN